MRAPGLAALLVAVLSTSAYAQKSEEEAGDVSEVDKDASGPLRERIRPVSGHLLLMDGRFEVSPGLGISFRDAFFTKYVLGAMFTYHLTEELALSARIGYAINVISGAARICTFPDPTATPPDPGGCRSPTWDELTKDLGESKNKAYGLIGFIAGVDFQWSPIYGKLSLLAERVLHFNMYGLVGPTVLTYGPNGTFTFGGNVGVGFRFVVNKWMAIRTELRDTIYYENGFPAGNDSVRNQLSLELGFSMFFPQVFQEGR